LKTGTLIQVLLKMGFEVTTKTEDRNRDEASDFSRSAWVERQWRWSSEECTCWLLRVWSPRWSPRGVTRALDWQNSNTNTVKERSSIEPLRSIVIANRDRWSSQNLGTVCTRGLFNRATTLVYWIIIKLTNKLAHRRVGTNLSLKLRRLLSRSSEVLYKVLSKTGSLTSAQPKQGQHESDRELTTQTSSKRPKKWRSRNFRSVKLPTEHQIEFWYMVWKQSLSTKIQQATVLIFRYLHCR